MRAVAATDVLQFALVMGGFAFIGLPNIRLKGNYRQQQKNELSSSIGDFFAKIQSKVIVAKEKGHHLSIWGHKRPEQIFTRPFALTDLPVPFLFTCHYQSGIGCAQPPTSTPGLYWVCVFLYILCLLLTFIGFGTALELWRW